MRWTFLLLLLAGSAHAQPVRIPGTSVSMTPPPGYRLADNFAGFQSDSLSASVIVTAMAEAPFGDVAEALTPEALGSQRVLFRERRKLTVDGRPAILVRAIQSQAGVRFDKWILLTGDAAGVVMVTANVPQEVGDDARRDVERAVLSLARTESGPSSDFEGLGFVLDAPPDLPHSARIGANVSYTERSGPAPAGGALYVAGRGFARLGADLDAAAEARIQQTVTMYGIRTVQTQRVVVDGKPSIETIAEALDETDDTEITIYQLLVPDGEGYVIAMGLIGTDRADEWLPRFRATTASIRWTE